MNPTFPLILSLLLCTEGRNYQGRIIGGQPVDISQAPFLVSILHNDGFECVGSLISNRWILTAADCINYGLRYSVRANSTYVDAAGQLVRVQAIVVHPKYSRNDNDYNFALLELDQDLDLKVAILPSGSNEDVLESGTILQALGWGKSSNTGEYHLRAGNLSVISRGECEHLLKDDYTVTERSFCAGSMYGGDSIRYGDSGSPLLSVGDEGGPVIVGVASRSDSDSFRSYCVFGWVSAVIEWIEAALKS